VEGVRTTLLLLLAACNGAIGDVPPGAGPPVDPSDPAYCDVTIPTPGHVTLRRLNRDEYNNTVRDLLGDTSRPADVFPTDNQSGEGFRNNADVLTISPLHLEKYDEAARALVTNAFAAGSEFRTRYVTCTEGPTCAREVAAAFGARAFRRPVDAEEIDRLVQVFDAGIAEGESFDDALALMIRAILISPRFLFRVEGAASGGLDDYAIASRLSYFLWATMPDDALFDRAASGELQDDAVIREEVGRMLADPKANEFIRVFSRDWLHLDKLAEASPDTTLYPGFDEALRGAMQEETARFVREVIDRDLPIGSLLSADFTFVNERLAAHYGIEGFSGTGFERVSTAGVPRGGILTQAGVLTVTSQPTRTSPVKRGQWVLDELLCAPPPDPPPDVDTLLEDEGTEGLSVRERLERHRANAECAVCHDLIDPLGFGLENYDAIGGFREMDGDDPVDASGELPDGTTFVGASGLAGVLRDDPRYAQCVTRKLVSYSIGRSVRAEDRCYVENILEVAAERDLSLREIIVQIVLSDVFRTDVSEAP
jgi:hypothetical protein